MSLYARLAALEAANKARGDSKAPLYVRCGKDEAKTADYLQHTWTRLESESEGAFLERVESELAASGEPAPLVWINTFFRGRAVDTAW